MKKGRLNSNAVVLSVLLVILVAVGVDLGRKLLSKEQPEPEPTERTHPRTPEFKVGDVAPDFSLPDGKGETHSLSSLVKGKTILHFTCGCAQCLETDVYTASLLKRLEKAGKEVPPVLNVTTMAKEREETWLRDTGLKQLTLFDDPATRVVGEKYKGHPCPRYFLLDGDRKVTFIGSSPMTPDPTPIAYEVAQALGFEAPDSKKKTALIAPHFKTATPPPTPFVPPSEQPPPPSATGS